jgi:RHS repeat-associated protein
VDDPQATNPAGWFARTYAYSASIPHAVTNVTPETGTPDTYEYDLNGNMTCRIENGVTYTHTYNAENRASSIAKRDGDCETGTILESWSFAYDGDGNRVTTAHFTGLSGTPDSTTSYFMGGAYEVKDSAVKKYYSIAGMMVAVNDGTGLQYLLTDHLGSTVAVTNSSGTLTSQQRYLPFGAPRTIPNSPILATDFGYTGQRLLDSGMGGIMDYRARFYSPALARFIQPDSIIPNQLNPQSWNRFSYVLNSPIIFNDPSGHFPQNCGPDNIYCGGLAENDYYSVPAPGQGGGGDVEDDDDEIISDPDDESDSCTFYTCVADCSDSTWGCGTDVSGTLQDPAVYLAGGTACLATGLCATLGLAGLSGLEELGWLALRMCAGNPICLRLAVVAGIYYPPNNGFAGTPSSITLNPSQIVTRYGAPDGRYASPIGTPLSARALPFQQWNLPITGYEVVKPIEVLAGPARAWFGLPGGGMQYHFSQTLETLVRQGILTQLP